MKCPSASLWDCSPWNDRALTMIPRNIPSPRGSADGKWFPPERNYTARGDLLWICLLLVVARREIPSCKRNLSTFLEIVRFLQLLYSSFFMTRKQFSRNTSDNSPCHDSFEFEKSIDIYLRPSHCLPLSDSYTKKNN